MEPFLLSKRLAFRRWTREDAPLASELWGDPAVTAFIGGPFTPNQIGDRLERELEADVRWSVQYWPIFERSTGAFVGCCGLRPYRPEDGVLELGFHPGTEATGQRACERVSAISDPFCFPERATRRSRRRAG